MNIKKFFRHLKIAAISLCTSPVLAIAARAEDGATDPIASVNLLTGMLVSIVKAVGGIACLWGIVQFGMSFQSHDTSQRTNGILFLVGGLVIFFAKEILALIGVAI